MEKLYFTIKSYELIIQYGLVLLFLGVGLTIFLFIMLSKFMIYLTNRRNKNINYKMEDNESDIDSIKKKIEEIINSKEFKDKMFSIFREPIFLCMSKEEIIKCLCIALYAIYFLDKEEFKIDEYEGLRRYTYEQIRGAIWAKF